MAATTVIAPLTIVLGASTLGPWSVPEGSSRYVLELDMANLTLGLTIECDYSPDGGTTWEVLGAATFPGPFMEGLQLNTTLEFGVVLGATGDPTQRVVATSNAQVRFVLNNALAFASAGGTMVAS